MLATAEEKYQDIVFIHVYGNILQDKVAEDEIQTVEQ